MRSVRATLSGLGLGDDAVGRIRGPAGLDLGAEQPEEIAVSILAEIVGDTRRRGESGAAAPEMAEGERTGGGAAVHGSGRAPKNVARADPAGGKTGTTGAGAAGLAPKHVACADPAGGGGDPGSGSAAADAGDPANGSAAWATDPVCGMTVPVAGSPSAVHNGRTLHFCCDGCRGLFEATPEVFAANPATGSGVRPEIRALREAMRRADYIAEPSIVTAVHLARSMEKPLLVEGDAGVGKTEIAKVMAILMRTELIRLQCYEGLDVNTALYEWNYQKQLLRLRMGRDEAEGAPDTRADHLEGVIFGRRYLLERPLLRAITRETPPVLLIDEIDRADEGFEAFLLEVLSDFQVTIPRAGHHPRDPPAARRAHLQPDARDRRRPPAALPLPLHRTPSLRQGGGDHPAPRCPGSRTPWPRRSRTSCRACARGVS